MDDNRIEIVAGLDIPKTKSTIKGELETDVKPYLDQTQALKITCHIDTKNIAGLQKQLSEASKGLKLNVATVGETKIDSKSITNAAQGFEQANSKALTLKKTLSDLESSFTKPFKAVLNEDGLINAERTLSKIQSRLSSLGTVTVKGNYGENNSADSLDRITATIQATSGEVRTLNFLLDDTDDKFKLLSSSYNDKGVGKVQQDIARLQKELANFESSHKSIENGLTQPLQVARNAITDLEAGVGSVESAQKALDNLKTAAAEIGSNLKSTGASFNIFDNAANKAKNFDNVLSAMKPNIEALSNEADRLQLGKDLESASNSLIELQRIEGELGRGKEWSNKYKEVSSSIQDITNNLQAAQKAEKALSQDASLLNRIEKLSASMSAFAVKNERAVKSTQMMAGGKTFAEEWQELSNALTKGGLKSDELKHLQERFAIFGKEAEAAGLKGKTAWEKFANSFKMFSSYITANMVFNIFKRQVRSMVQEVINLDSAMTELRKVTEATEPEFNKFLETAKQSAQYLGSSVTDLVDATSTFSRLGYSLKEAQNLGEIATLYKNVGDGIDISTASESIVSTLKAFKIEAEDAITIVDKFNEVDTCPFYILIERNRRHIFSNCWEILKSFSLLFSKRRKPETSKRIAYGEKKHMWFAKPYMS